MQNPNAPKSIGPYQQHVPGDHSTMTYGTYYEKEVYLPFDVANKRSIRVWLPEGYGEEGRRYPVIYFSDGQNLVDNELSAYGDWGLDKIMHRLQSEGYPPAILVGVDCPKEVYKRTNELNPPYMTKLAIARHHKHFHPIANIYIEYIIQEIKPEIDRLFLTLSDLRHTGIGGSSMGGIMAFYAYMHYPETFGFSLSFSIPVFFYSYAKWKQMLEEWDFKAQNNRKLAIYVGGEGFEARFHKGTRWLIQYLRDNGYDETCLHYQEDISQPHHEAAWHHYSYEALRFFLQDLKN